MPHAAGTPAALPSPVVARLASCPSSLLSSVRFSVASAPRGGQQKGQQSMRFVVLTGDNAIATLLASARLSAVSIGDAEDLSGLMSGACKRSFIRWISLLWSFTLATRVCLVRGNSVFVVDVCRFLTNAPCVQPPTRAGCFRLEEFISVCVEGSRAQLLFLCAESHRQSCLHRFGTHRPGERLLSSNDVKENSEAMSYGGVRNPNAAVAANLGLRLLGV